MNWDFECDMLVAGSGGGALTGAYVAASEGLDTLVIESTDRFGGTTCYSGGAVWLPGNQASQRDGLDDSNDTALEYFQTVVCRRLSSATGRTWSSILSAARMCASFISPSPTITAISAARRPMRAAATC
jgi:flavin-dependent dehydrogenase